VQPCGKIQLFNLKAYRFWFALRHAFIVLQSMAMLGACGSVVPAPRYTPDAHSPIVAELQRRRLGDDRRLLEVVNRYLGVPYKWGGTTRQGMDCSAFTRAIFREAYGIELPRTSRQMYELGLRILERRALRPGDLVFFRDTHEGPGVAHVGIYVGNGHFAHASATQGGVITSMSIAYFNDRYVGARRIQR
jgi:cell wall-associated NlpC family hydrolase